jgi:hypothetical protein
MKKDWMRWMIIAFLLVGGIGINQSNAQGVVSLQVFYDELRPYGTWMHNPSYGQVWVPRVDRSFVPYGTNGYWIQTEYGNTWVSDYNWGWAPFHYGRWFFDDFYGWVWVPDTVWAPAWVVWRSGGGYYGWAPLMPGLNIHVSLHYYNRIPNYYWNFVPYRYVTYRHVHRHCVPRTQVVNVIHNTTIVNHNYTDNRRQTFFTGPSRSDIERRNGSRVEVYKINDRNRPGVTSVDRGEVSFYRPDLSRSRQSGKTSVPSRVMQDNDDLKNFESRMQRSDMQRKGLSDNVQSYQRGTTKNRNADINRRTLPDDFDAFQRSRERDMQQLNSINKEKQMQRNVYPDQSSFRREQQRSFEKQNERLQNTNPVPQRERQLRQDGNQQTMKQQMQKFDRQSNESFNRSNFSRERSNGTINKGSTYETPRLQSLQQRSSGKSNESNGRQRSTR